MIKIKNRGAQGDVMFRRAKAVPDGFVKSMAAGPIVVAHSETGHHHVVEDPTESCLHFTSPTDSMVAYLQLGDECIGAGGIDIVHQRPFDTHETLRLLGKPGDVFEVRRQREWTPEGWRQVAD